MNKSVYIASFFIIISCGKPFLKNEVSKTNVSEWHKQDYILNNIFGISLDKWHSKNIKKTKNEIIVATIDSQIDLDHISLKKNIWINKNEIPNNGIDDDKNGYIDDVNGWNFIGKSNGGYFRYGNFEYTKVVRNFKNHFYGKEKVASDSIYLFNEYNRALKLHKAYSNFYKNYINSLDYSIKIWPLAKDTLKHFFPNEDYTLSQLDSIYQLYKINDKSFYERRDDNDTDLGALIDNVIANYEIGKKELKDLITSRDDCDSILNRNLNIEYNPRKFLNDNPFVLEKGYGNNILNNNPFQLGHNTSVTSIIVANENSSSGFHENIKVMPLVVSCSGDEYDKDIAMAIYYAVDNGAKIINMSFGKEFSLHQEWVTEAFKYAEKKGVLLVHGSGNKKFNVDKNPYYPSDYDYKEEKVLVNNFINVGSISKRTDSTMVSSFSNYGKMNVDLFAPGEEIYVATPDNNYKFDSGTSLAAPMVSGTAALIWLYFPKLSVQEVKQIILDSGITIDKNVIKPGTRNEMVPFSDLCKSGKILNTYNAMKMAESKYYSRNKQ